MKRVAVMVENSRAYGRAMIEGIAAYAQERRDWILRPLSVEDASAPRLRDFDGVIARLADGRLADRIARAGIPAVDVFCQTPRKGFGAVDSDHADIGRKARNFLASRGFTNFAYCGFPGATFSEVRGQAFADERTFVYTRSNPRPADQSQFYAERVDRIPDARQLARWVRALPKPIAVFCCNDLRAVHLLHVARDCGFRVPEDLVLLGVDNDTILCSYAEVPISSIDPNAFQVGYDAARVLCAIMSRKPLPRDHRCRFVRCGGVIERASTDFMPVDPPWLGEVLMHVERNMRRPIPAREIFALAHRSGTYVENVFRAKLGMSVQSYVTAQKLKEARRLCRNPALRISEIGYLCGFTSPQYFSRVFTAATGRSPRAYRAAHPKDAP